MALKYKIFHNNICIYICKEEDIAKITESESITEIIPSENVENIPVWLNYLQLRQSGNIIITTPSPNAILQKLYTKCKKVIAAGGVVQNDYDEFLLMYRRGYWDMPKGKLDPGETLEQCAIREVQEETGLKHITLGPALAFKPFAQTYTLHTFKTKSGWNIKPSYWYHMRVNGRPALRPQYDEDIHEAIWVPRAQLQHYIKPAYSSIAEILVSLLY